MKHPKSQQIALLKENALDTEAKAQIEAHVKSCPKCAAKLAYLRSDDDFLASIREPLRSVATAVPINTDVIDRIVLPRLANQMSTLLKGTASSPVFVPNQKPSHADAPKIPNYVLIEKIGEGSFGAVWRAEDMVGNPCAVKVLLKSDKNRAGDYELRGIEQVMKLQHPNLVQIKHVGQTDDHWFYVMELVAETLETRLKQKPCFSPEEAITTMQSLLCALDACHVSGVAHRDIKPANIGFMADGTLKLLDLGLTTSADRSNRTLVGTPEYMPHKPARTPDLDDIYAAGLVLYRMVTGNPLASFPLVPTDEAVSPLLTRLARLSVTAADPIPENRFESAKAFLELIQGISNSGARNPKPARIRERMADAKEIGVQSQKTNKAITNNTVFLMQELINKAANIMREAGLVQHQKNLEQEARLFSNDKYKVAVIGKFKAGKSTLINKVLLKEDILFTDPLEATAVPTEIEYGAAPGALEVYPWETPTGCSGVDGGVSMREAAPHRIENPTTEDIKSATTHATAEGRATMAEKTARVRLPHPAQSLKGLTVVDTPGIDSLNQAVVTTTYRVVPEADVTLYVTRPNQLGQIDTNFLRSRVFEAGISRTMVAINYNPEFGRMAQENLDQIATVIQGQLKDMGRSNVPVITVRMDGASHFETSFQDFVRTNSLPGRVERSKAIVKREVEQALTECKIELAALQKSPEELALIVKQIDEKTEQFKKEYERIKDDFLLEFAILQNEHVRAMCDGLDRISKSYLDGYEHCNLSAAQNRLKQTDFILKPELENLMLQVSADIRSRVREMENKYRGKFEMALNPVISTVTNELRIDGGIFAEVPYAVVLIADLLLTVMLAPFGAPADLIMRLIASRIPGINRFLPIVLVRNVLVGKISDEIMLQFADMKKQLRIQLSGQYRQTDEKLKSNWLRNSEEILTPIVAPLKREMDGRDPKRQVLLTAAQEKIQQFLVSLS